LAFFIFSEIIFLNTLASLITQQVTGAVSGIIVMYMVRWKPLPKRFKWI